MAGDEHDRLSQISTAWTELRQAQAGPPEAAAAAQRMLLQRYGGAVRRYLASAVRDPAEADDLAQEFALAVVRGTFRHADPGRGRFRDYLKTTLFHLVAKHRKARQRDAAPVAADSPDVANLAAPEEDLGRRFDEEWRAELLARTWAALDRVNPAFHAVLRFRAAHHDMPSHEMAGRLSEQLGKPMSADGVRQALRRARDQFADLLLDEVAHSLDDPTVDRLEDELTSLGLLSYCQPALDRRRAGGG